MTSFSLESFEDFELNGIDGNGGMNCEDQFKEIKELKKLNVWGESQEVLENQALKELERFTDQNTSKENSIDLEKDELVNDKETATVGKSNNNVILDISSYIKRQEQLKKQQELKRSLEISKCSKIAAERASASHNKTISSNLLKRKSSFTTQKLKRKRKDSKSSNGSLFGKDEASGSEYYPSDSDEEEIGVSTVKNERKSKLKTEKILDDGCIKLYKSRLTEYYENLENKRGSNSEQITDIETSGGLKVPLNMWNNLYSYQQDGIDWLWRMHQQMTGGLLGDEMGLGKTVQVIVFLAALENTKTVSNYGRYKGLGPTLIVSPATVIHQWVKHFHDWAPEFRVAILHQSGSFIGNKMKLLKDINKAKGILVTTYLGVLKYKGILTELNWHYLILDEGHKIRNPNAKISIAVKQIPTAYRILLTGCPMQNNLQELWSLFDFVVPGMLGTLPTFMEHFANPIMRGGFANATSMEEATALSVASALKDLISTHLLRRSKHEVQKHICLPNKSEQVLFCSLTDEQYDLYKGYLMSEHVSMILGRGGKNWFSENHIRANVLIAITTLRKICNHPDLYLGETESNYFNKSEDEIPVEDRFGYYKRCGKMVVVSALLKIWKKQKHRVLLFTQSRAMITIAEDFLKQQEYKYLKMDGTTNISSRQLLIEQFNQDSSYTVFLLTTKVGGLGVNLTGANRVIIYDPDWNPATDSQAKERAWRIGQDKDVTIYRLISAGTIEEKMYQRQVWKQLLSNKVLLDPRTQKFFKSSDLHDLFSLQERTNSSNPETANIFRNSRVHIETNMKRKRNMKTTSTESTVQFSSEKIEAMKKLAQQIAKSMSSDCSNNIKTDEKSSYQIDLENERSQKLEEKEQLKKLTPMELRVFNRKKYEPVKEISTNKIDDADTKISFANALIVSEKTAEAYNSLKNKTITNTHPDIVSNSNCIKKCNDSVKNEIKVTKKEHKSNVKIDKSGVVDGEVVEGLLRREVSKNKTGSHKINKINESQDKYVLEKLFLKKGVQTVLKHDVIVQANLKNQNSIKNSYEAQKKTELALDAIKKSRLKTWRW